MNAPEMKRFTAPAMRLHPNDNVLVARLDLAQGSTLAEENLTCLNRIPAGHKIAARTLGKGEPVLKYNTIIGFAAADIRPGTLVHAHHMAFREFDRDYAHARDYKPVDMVPEAERASFMGIVRADGRVATRNYIGIVSTVNCSATVSHRIAEWFTPERLAEFPNVDGVAAFTHATGCGMEFSGEPMDMLRRTLAGYICHPNMAAVLVVGLGCERNQIATLFQSEKLSSGTKLRTFVMQETGGTRQTIAAGVAAVKELLPQANCVTRVPVAASHIIVGLQCGGSDSFSSISANPALGAAMDILVRHGGANVVCFTTGRGSAFGCKPSPSIKLAANTPMFRKLEEDMDINCGQILDGTASMDEMGEQIFRLILRTASGDKTKSEELGLGEHEFVPWQIGITG